MFRKTLDSALGSLINTIYGLIKHKTYQAITNNFVEIPDILPTSTILITDVREPPYISQIHSKSNDREEKVHLFAPFVTWVSLRKWKRQRVIVRGSGILFGVLVCRSCGVLFWHAASPVNQAGFQLSKWKSGRIS